MAADDKIKLFKFTLKIYQHIGIYPPAYNQTPSPINRKNCFFLISLVQFFITTAAHLFVETNSIIEYGLVFFPCLNAILGFSLYSFLMWEMEAILNYIGNWEQFINKSEY